MASWCSISFSGYCYCTKSLYLNGELVTDLVIPDGVTSISNYVFYNCTDLKSVTIPGSVTSIGEGAFYGCTDITSINIPNSVEIIGDYAFANCTSLKTLNVPESAMFIGNYAFAKTAITSVVMPSTAIVYEGAFSDWTAEQTVNVKLSAYKAWSIWSLTWNKGTNGTVVWDYVPTV